MKSKELLKIAEACRDGFVSGIKRALGIKKHSPSFTPKQKEEDTSGEAMSSFIQMAEAMGGARHSLDEAGTQAQKLIQTMTEYNGFVEEINRACREQTNNWKKMHGLPMRRKTMQERKRKTK